MPTNTGSTNSMSTIQEFSQSTGQQENDTTMATITSNAGISVALIGAVVGGVAGSLLMLALVLLLLALVWMTRKYKRAVSEAQCNLHHHEKVKLEESEQREATHQQQHQGDEVMEMKSNDAYISNTRQIPTEDNVAYSQTTPKIPTEDNVAYSQTTPKIPTEDNVAYGQIESDYNLLNDQCEYEYI